ncbi:MULTISPECIES: universal stress protein [Amycolatopsis]|uniref:Universal stress protein n=1 Tax=Amycolatopsis dendrobii TaxID=2760662 RepID=A0A7W3VSI8_9PSEU|nr:MULTISPECIES: universal stress protein [Amycolatopsis]MBB1152269.1 universal stress protein [Amycolatopsis dendrobii]UKD57459.1 universal stress protein [Amycolatopsis sp. FU40]
MKTPRFVVVGVDGSSASVGALLWAAAAAAASGAELRVVSAWLHDPLLDDLSIGRNVDEASAAHLAELEAFVAETVKDPAVTVRCSAPEGDAASMLIDRARNAALLVVGSHGKGMVRQALTGSVSTACLRRASCPVAVVPPRALAPESRLGRKISEVTGS